MADGNWHLVAVSVDRDQADGVRCDMAMLVMNNIFERTWGPRAGARPSAEYWPEVIQAVKKKYPDFLFMAEAYWDQEWELQQQGFSYCYDKKLYDRMEHADAEHVIDPQQARRAGPRAPRPARLLAPKRGVLEPYFGGGFMVAYVVDPAADCTGCGTGGKKECGRKSRPSRERAAPAAAHPILVT